MIEITDEMVERLARFLQAEWAGPYMARIRDFIPPDMPRGPDFDHALAEMHAAERAAENEARRVARLALAAALPDH
jgi:hypothetical protein